MKQAMKELVDSAKRLLGRFSLPSTKTGISPDDVRTARKTIVFLDSLPEIESHLYRGGYIQDSNGTPCCDGDEVKFCVGKEKRHGTILWNRKYASFYISEIFSPEDDIEDEDIYFVRNVIWFEKESKE